MAGKEGIEYSKQCWWLERDDCREPILRSRLSIATGKQEDKAASGGSQVSLFAGLAYKGL